MPSKLFTHSKIFRLYNICPLSTGSVMHQYDVITTLFNVQFDVQCSVNNRISLVHHIHHTHQTQISMTLCCCVCNFYDMVVQSVNLSIATLFNENQMCTYYMHRCTMYIPVESRLSRVYTIANQIQYRLSRVYTIANQNIAVNYTVWPVCNNINHCKLYFIDIPWTLLLLQNRYTDYWCIEYYSNTDSSSIDMDTEY